MVKHLPTMQETWVWFLGGEDPQEKEMATHSSTFTWKIPWMEEPGGLQSMGSQRVGHDWATSLSFFHFLSAHGDQGLYLFHKRQSESQLTLEKVKVKSLSHVQLFVTPWTAVYQAPPSMGFPVRVTADAWWVPILRVSGHLSAGHTVS